MITMNCKGKLINLNSPVVMGIINITPDSFYKGFLNDSIENIVKIAGKMIEEGALILDIGGQSTRPGATLFDETTEAERVIPVIESIHQHFPNVILSVDTFYAKVAQKAVLAGASIINDISAGNYDQEMLDTVADLNVPFICMHMKGMPENMQNNPVYNNVVADILNFFINKIEQCKKKGINDLIIDPGFGFGKTIQHNFQILQSLSNFNILNVPILAGLSRKGMIYKSLGITTSESLNGTTVLNTLALNNGAKILRVHDVKEAVEAIKLYNLYNNAAL
jgi:dihydropteroate synthase